MLSGNSERSHPILAALVEEFHSELISRREFLTKSTALGMASITALQIVGISASTTAKAQSRGGIAKCAMRVMDPGDPRSLYAPEQANALRGFLEPLVLFKNNFTFEPWLVENWEVNEDASEYTLRVRRNASWSNGDSFTADDIIFNFQRWADTTDDRNSMHVKLRNLVDQETGQLRSGSVKKIDDFTVKVYLIRPDISFIPTLSDYTSLVVHRSYSNQVGSIIRAPIGTGPFDLVSYDVGQKVVYARRQSGNWWNGEVMLDGFEYIDYGSDPNSLISALREGEVDLTTEDIGSEPYFGGSKIYLQTAMTSSTVLARGNQRKSPYDDIRVRRALQLCVDNVRVIADVGPFSGIPAENHHVCPIQPEYFALPMRESNRDTARSLMRESGMEGFEHELLTPTTERMRKFAESIADQIREAGFRIKVTAITENEFWVNWTDHPFSVTSWGMQPLGVQTLNLAYRSGAPWNESGFANPEFDVILDRASTVLDADQRRGLVRELELILQDDATIIQPYWLTNVMYASGRVIGAEPHQTGEHHQFMWSINDGNNLSVSSPETCSSFACAINTQCCKGTCRVTCN